MCWCDRLSVRYARSATTDRYLCHQMENVRLWFLWLHRLRWYIWGFKSSPSISIQSFVYLRRMLLTSPIPCLLQFLETRPYITFKCFCYYSQTVVESVNASTWPSPWGRGTSNQTGFTAALRFFWWAAVSLQQTSLSLRPGLYDLFTLKFVFSVFLIGDVCKVAQQLQQLLADPRMKFWDCWRMFFFFSWAWHPASNKLAVFKIW